MEMQIQYDEYGNSFLVDNHGLKYYYDNYTNSWRPMFDIQQIALYRLAEEAERQAEREENIRQRDIRRQRILDYYKSYNKKRQR